MLFNSHIFIFAFLPISFVIYFSLLYAGQKKLSQIALLALSLFFYSWWEPKYLILISASIGLNYLFSNLILGSDKYKKHYFWTSIFFNLGLLCFYKYTNFIILNVNAIAGTSIESVHIDLPLAISFFTLQQVAYLTDAYEGLVEEHSFYKYSLFVTFFPQLIAGPIVHHKQIIPQFDKTQSMRINSRNMALGLLIFSIGLFKKVIIADGISTWADMGFQNHDKLSFIGGWITSISYTLQLYFDFSGYTDMAIGIGTLFNIELPINFNSPYKAANIIDFWKRWHLTLTSFITNYVYTPIVRFFKKITFSKMMLASFIAMFISGLWHGASWTFVFWGCFHGAGIIVNHLWKKHTKKKKIKISPWPAWFITINFVNISFVFFRATSFKMALDVLQAMFGLKGIILPTQLRPFLSQVAPAYITFGNFLEQTRGKLYTIPVLIILCLATMKLSNTGEIRKEFDYNYKWALILAICLATSIMGISRNSPFLYFNF